MSSRSSSTSVILESINGSPKLLGTITADATTAKNSQSTAVPFNIPLGQRIILQGDANFRFRTTPEVEGGPAVLAAATAGVYVAIHIERQLCLRSFQLDVSILSDSGTANVQVWALQ